MTAASQKKNKEEKLDQFILELRPLVGELIAILAEHPQIPCSLEHELSRPGLHINTNWHSGEVTYLDIGTPDSAMLSLHLGSIISLSTYVKIPGGEDQRLLNVSGAPSGSLQSTKTIKGWNVDFAHAVHALSGAIHCIREGLPFYGPPIWNEALRQYLEQETEKSFRLDKWTHWLETWGTLEMQQSMELVDNFVERQENFENWKMLVIANWRNLEKNEISSLEVDAAIFEQ